MFFTKALVKIDKRIEAGLTRLFLDTQPGHVLAAEAHARQTRSYVYPVYGYVGERKNMRFQQIGLAVPK